MSNVRPPRMCAGADCPKPADKGLFCWKHLKRVQRTLPSGDRPRVPLLSPLERLEYYGWDVTASGCWEWRGPRDGRGYGSVKKGSGYGTLAAHRLSAEIAHGPIPPGMFVCHSCDNPPCMNPDHLWFGTAADNMADMHAKGRWARAGAKANPAG